MIRGLYIERLCNGAFLVSAIVNGYREQQTYMGFTRRESLILFRDKYLRGKHER